jgi:putative inorganic carbon (hco3(-)) transporter
VVEDIVSIDNSRKRHSKENGQDKEKLDKSVFTHSRLFTSVMIYGTLLMTFLVILFIETKHFQPFVNSKNSIFIFSVSLLSISLIIKLMFESKFKFSYSLINIFAILYLFWNIISYYVFQYTSKIYLILTICYLLLFFIVQYIFTKKDVIKVFFSFSIINILMGIYGIMQFLGKDFSFFVNYFGSRFEIGTRVFTTLGNPNLQGGYSVFILPITIAFFIYSYRLFRKSSKESLFKSKLLLIFAFLSFVFNFLLLLMAQTRGSWIAGFVTIIVFIILYYWKKEFIFIKKHIVKSIIILLVLIFLGVFVFSILPETIVNPQTVDIRLFYYQNTVDMIIESPSTLLFGRGIGSFSAYYPLFRDKRIAYGLGEKNLEFRVEHPHNEHLEILSDLGIIGYLFFVGLVLSAIFLLLRKNDILSKGIAVALIGVLFDGLMMQNLRFVSIALLFWFALGLSSIGVLKITKENNKVININKNIFLMLISIILIFMLFSILIFSLNHYQQGESVKQGLFYYTNQNNQKAVYFLQDSYDKDSTDKRTLYYLAPSYESIGNDDEALKYYKQLLDLDNNFIQANSNLAMIYFKNGDIVSSKKYFLRQIRSNNMFWRPYYMLAYIFIGEGNLQKSFENTIELLEINKLERLPDEVLIFALKVQGQYYAENKIYEEMIEVYQKLYEILPEGEEKSQIDIILRELR